MESEVTRLRDGIWKVVALTLAKKHKMDARAAVEEVCGSIEAHLDSIRESNDDVGPSLQDALAEFKSEACKYELR